MDDLRSPTGDDPTTGGTSLPGTDPEWGRELPDVGRLPLAQLAGLDGGVLDNSLHGLLADLERRERYSAFGSVIP